MFSHRLLRLHFLHKLSRSRGHFDFCSSVHPGPSLSAEFALSREWADRMGKQSMVEADEFVSAVQKKFSGGGKASAVDLDLACMISTQPSQITDLIDLCYKLRHTDNATDLFPSTEYAIYRLLLEGGDMDNFLKILNDPINYGLFMNEHLCCLYLDRFLGSGNVLGAAKVAIYAMHQELFAWPLLNFLATNALLRWVELEPAERAFEDQMHPRRPATLEEETSFNEENVRLFRYPYVKNHYFDGHFDLEEPDHLVGKSLEWFSGHLKLADGDERQRGRNSALIGAINTLGLMLQKNWAEARDRLKSLTENAGSDEKEIIRIVLQNAQILMAGNDGGSAESKAEKSEENKNGEEGEETEEAKLKKWIDQKRRELISAEGEGETAARKLSAMVAEAFQPILKEEEQKLMDRQRKEYGEWTEHRKQFIQSQATRAEVMARLEEVRRRRKELAHEREVLYFFEKRIHWEDEARERDQLVEELGLMKKRGELTEEEYAQSMFHLARQLKEGKTAKQALDDIAESELFTRIQERKAKAVGQ